MNYADLDMDLDSDMEYITNNLDSEVSYITKYINKLSIELVRRQAFLEKIASRAVNLRKNGSDIPLLWSARIAANEMDASVKDSEWETISNIMSKMLAGVNR